jgi:hypothetical protein
MTTFDTVADGNADAAPALQAALDAGGDVSVPAGTYRLGATLRMPSETTLTAAADARFHLADGVCRTCHDFIVTNANPGNGNRDITLQGGLWDANNAGNPRGAEFDPLAYTGVAVNFINVAGLTLRDLRIHNPEAFFIRLGEVSDFCVEDIRLSADLIRLNQDGVHVGGYSCRGCIRGIHAHGAGVPNDDMVALNADDDVERQLNRGMRRGPIHDIQIEDIVAEDAYTFLRLLSVDQPIRDITVRGLRGSCRIHGVNLNNWRFPKGVGNIRGVLLEDVDLAKTEHADGCPALIKISLAVDDLTIRDLRRRAETHPDVRTLLIDNDQELELTRDGARQHVTAAAGLGLDDVEIAELRLHGQLSGSER